MKSMTGYGKGVVQENGRSVTIELKAVNNRYLEINSRLPKSLSMCDDIILKEIPKFIKRGSIEVFFNYDNTSEDSKKITLDLNLANEYFKAARDISNEFLLDNDLGTTAILRSPEVIKIEYSKDDPEVLEKLVKKCIELAAKELDQMREKEGETIKRSLMELTGNIVDGLQKVIVRAPKVVDEHRLKLENRIKEALKGVDLDQTRLLNEVAFFADKADINEEISRLSSHISQFVETLNTDEPSGRKLDFISQEMNREINTMGSKSNDIELTSIVVEMKNELEKVKEQIRNVE